MRVEIVDIGKGDSYYYRRENIIGKKGTFATAATHALGGRPVGFDAGAFYFDDGGRKTYFYEVKTKPIFDA